MRKEIDQLKRAAEAIETDANKIDKIMLCVSRLIEELDLRGDEVSHPTSWCILRDQVKEAMAANRLSRRYHH